MPHFVLARNEVPEGDQFDIEAILKREAPFVRAILDRYHIPVESLIPSRDGARFAGVRQVEIPPLVQLPMEQDLNRAGYRLEGPFASWKEAREYWQTGVLESEPTLSR
jgi:hypothetical protein